MVDAERILAALIPLLDKSTATIITTDDSEKRHFIGETMLIAAGIFLLEHYCAAFLEGVGLHDLGKSHGEKASALLTRVRMGNTSKSEIEEEKNNLPPMINQVVEQSEKDSGKTNAERSVEALLVKAGLTARQARETAGAISTVILNK